MARRAHWLAAALLVLLLWLALVGEIRGGRRCAADEPHWITSGFLTFELVSELAGPSRWAVAYNERDLGDWGNMNPPIAKLIIGSFVALAREPDQPIDFRWKFGFIYKQNLAAGNLPPTELLERVRYGISVLGALALALVYVLSLQVTRARWLSLLAPLALFLLPNFRFHATHVYADMPQLLFMLASLVIFNRFLRVGHRGVLVAALGCMGLAVAAKFSASPVVMAAGAYLFFRPGPWRRRLGEAILAGVIPLVVFCAVNPFLYPAPFSRTWLIISAWSETMGQLRRAMYFSRPATSSPLDGLVLTSQRTLAAPAFELGPAAGELVGPIAGMLLAALLGIALLRLRGELSRCSRGRALAWAVGSAAVAAGASALAGWSPAASFLILGVCGLTAGGLSRGSDPATGPQRAFLFTTLGATWLVTGLWLPLDLPRYYLRLLVLLPAFYVSGAWVLVDLARAAVPPRGGSGGMEGDP